MNTHSTVLDNASAEATTSDRILQTALAALRQEYAVLAEHRLYTWLRRAFCMAFLKTRSTVDRDTPNRVKNKALFVTQQEKHQTNPNIGVAT
jgi:hypothetical protein